MPNNLAFTITHKFTKDDSLNEIYAGKHWRNRKAYADSMHLIVKNAMKLAGIKARDEGVLFLSPVNITLTFPFDGVDIDNHTYFSKCVVDCLKGLVIKDDNPKWVHGINQRFGKRENILVEVQEIEQRANG